MQRRQDCRRAVSRNAPHDCTQAESGCCLIHSPFTYWKKSSPGLTEVSNVRAVDAAFQLGVGRTTKGRVDPDKTSEQSESRNEVNLLHINTRLSM